MEPQAKQEEHQQIPSTPTSISSPSSIHSPPSSSTQTSSSISQTSSSSSSSIHSSSFLETMDIDSSPKKVRSMQNIYNTSHFAFFGCEP